MKEIGPVIRISLLLMIVCGLAYPLALTSISQAVMPEKSMGSLVYDKKGEAVGSELIGQPFTDPRYFNSRVSSIGYDASGSGSPNEAPSNPALLKRVKTSIEKWKRETCQSTADRFGHKFRIGIRPRYQSCRSSSANSENQPADGNIEKTAAAIG